LVNADGTNPVGFERPPGLLSLLRSPDWSPDGSQLLVSSDAKVHTLDLDDGELRLLVDLGGQILARARWSPDGKSVLLSQFSTVYVMGLDGSAPVKIGDQTASDWGTSPAITVSDARFEPRWVLSRQLGTIVLRGTASHASSVTVTLRSAMRSYPPMPTSIPAGDYTVSVRLRSDLLPGTYEIVVGGISGSERLLDTARSAQLAAPAAGLVARSWISAKPGGAPRDRVDRGPRRLYAHFAFSPRPKKGQRLVAVWLAPSGAVRLRVLVSPAATVRSVIADERGLVSGRWRCRLEVGGAAVAIASIRVG
jgi:WD40 repeat protein